MQRVSSLGYLSTKAGGSRELSALRPSTFWKAPILSTFSVPNSDTAHAAGAVQEQGGPKTCVHGHEVPTRHHHKLRAARAPESCKGCDEINDPQRFSTHEGSPPSYSNHPQFVSDSSYGCLPTHESFLPTSYRRTASRRFTDSDRPHRPQFSRQCLQQQCRSASTSSLQCPNPVGASSCLSPLSAFYSRSQLISFNFLHTSWQTRRNDFTTAQR